MDIITYALCKKADRQIIDMIQSMEKLTITVVDEVPTIETAEPNRLYLVDTNHDGTYEMYILAEVEGEEEVVELGPVVDFSDYYTKEQIDGMVTPIKRLSDSEYTALTTAQKNNGTLYLVYEGVVDNHSVIGYDSEGKFVYKMTPYGCTNGNAAGNYNNHTTIAPQITGPNRFGEGDYCMKVELADGTIYYFNSSFKYGMGGSASLSNYEGNVVDAEGSNVFFQANGGSTFNIMKGENDTWIGNTYIIEAPNVARFVLGTIPTGKTAIYYKSEKYAETKPDATDVVYSNATSGLSATNVQAAIDELNTNDVGKKEYVNNELKGEVFNVYTGNGKNIASGQYSHAEGQLTAVYSDAGHAEGKYTIVGSAVVDPETGETTYTGTGATFGHAEGYTSHAAGYTSHAEGSGTLAAGVVSHAEGYATQARGDGSHSEGYATIAAGGNSHAEGHTTFAQGLNSHASGYHTRANSDNSTVIGKYNIADGTEENDPKHLFIVGNGTSDARSNILEVSDTYLNVNGDIKQNGVTITSTPHTELTQAQYDALQNPDAGTEYFITDATSGVAVSALESRLAALEMQETVYYVNGVQRVPLYSQNITKVVKVDDNTVDWYFLEPTSQKTYKARVTAQGEGNTRTNPLIIVTEVNS